MKMNPLIRIGIHEPAEMNGASSLTWLGGLLLLLFLHRPGLLAPRRRRPGICCTGPPPDLPPGAAPPPIRAIPGRIHLPFPRRPPPSLPCSSPARPELQHECGQQPPGVERDGERHERRGERRWRTWECGGRPEDPEISRFGYRVPLERVPGHPSLYIWGPGRLECPVVDSLRRYHPKFRQLGLRGQRIGQLYQPPRCTCCIGGQCHDAGQ